MLLPALVPAEAGDDAVGGARVLHLDHRALARLVDAVLRLGDHAVEAGALEARQPLAGDARGRASSASGGSAAAASASSCSSSRAPLATAADPRTIASVDREQVEGDERCRRLLRELRDARGGRMQAQLQRVEVEPVRRRDHDLAVDDAAVGQAAREAASCSSGK